MNLKACARGIAGSVAILAATCTPTPTAVAPVSSPVVAAAPAAAPAAVPARALFVSHDGPLRRALHGLDPIAPPTQSTWLIEVQKTSPDLDPRIDVFHSDPAVQCRILILDSSGRYLDPPKSDVAAKPTFDGRRVLVDR